MNIQFVTSFNKDGYELYGKAMLESWKMYSDFPITVFVEGAIPNLVKSVIIRYVPLDMRPIIKHINVENALVKNDDYRFKVGRFARKVYAITDEKANVYGADWRIWLDADTLVKSAFSAHEFIEDVLIPANLSSVAYLGRKNWHHSECGFVAYHMQRYAADFLHYFRKCYETMDYLGYSEWHDSFVFDELRYLFEDRSYMFYDLSCGLDLGDPKVKGNDALHIWPHTVLGKYFEHKKGKLKIC